MKKSKALVIGLFLLVILWGLLRMFRQDAIEAEVNASALQSLQEAGLNWVQVSNEGTGRDISLAGIARSADDIAWAESIAKSANGVRTVDSSEVVLKEFKPASLVLSFDANGATLSGEMQSNEIVDSLVGATYSLGNGNVTNKLNSDGDVAAPQWLKVAPTLFKSLSVMETGRLEIGGESASLSGLVRTQQQLETIHVAVKATGDVLSITADGLELRPYVTGLRLSMEQNTLKASGTLDNETNRTQLIRSLEEYFGSVDTGELQIGNDVEAVTWIDSVEAILPGLAALENPSLDWNGLGGQVDGVARDNASLDAMQTALDGLPDSVTSISNIELRPWLDPKIQVTRNGSIVTISGLLPSEAISQKIIDAANVVSDEVNADSLVVNVDAIYPEWLESVLLGIKGLSYLSEGELIVQQDGLQLSGTADTDRESDAIHAALADSNSETGLVNGLKLDLEVTLTDEMVCETAPAKNLDQSTVEFETESASISQSSFPLLDELVGVLASCPDSVFEIAGHTDNYGDPAYNQNLSERRASSVIEYMVTSGVAADRLKAKGYGSDSPIADNATSEGRALNRRIEMHIITTR